MLKFIIKVVSIILSVILMIIGVSVRNLILFIIGILEVFIFDELSYKKIAD